MYCELSWNFLSRHFLHSATTEQLSFSKFYFQLRKRTADGKVKVSKKDTKDLTVIVMSDDATNNTNNCSVNIETELMLG